ncbi:dehydrodolichyl diphosphate synthase complex subunit nus1 [Schistocerca cancellata]|uniref:dehydrodolichyl diphosphate synthase complex subunit nus1 n=1 Tax=Schistocerca cancellata TaxID=274614 RepID=UPI0021197986|nr:dehydrodolichyl diphosphate synthase complex subunit nus1 [Schistocerca cancellata]
MEMVATDIILAFADDVVILGDTQEQSPFARGIWRDIVSISSGAEEIEGHLQQNQDELYQAVKTRSKLCVGRIIWGRNKTLNGLGVENGVQNGTKAIAKTRVTVLSLNDSKETFLKVTRSLCYSAKNREVKSCHISQDVINEMLTEETGLPEPELALYCGEVCCTYGFLPWHIRITEFLRLRSHHNITVREFVRLLQTYGKCEQRFGK